MVRTRHSKRLAGGKLAEDTIPPRARKASSRALSAFNTNQPAIQRPTKRKRAATLKTNNPPATPQAKEALSNDPQTPQAPSNDPQTPQAPSIENTPLARRTKPPPPIFDPNEYGEFPLYIQAQIYPMVDSNLRKICIPYSLNINDPFENLNSLYELVERKYVNQWADNRNLQGGQKPVKKAWIVLIGDPKKSGFTTQISDEQDWKGVCVYLRSSHHSGDKKTYRQIVIEAQYATFDRKQTPPPFSQQESRFKNVKGPKSVRETVLISSDAPEEEEEEASETDIELDADFLTMVQRYKAKTAAWQQREKEMEKKKEKKPRNSVTNQQLAAKKSRVERQNNLERLQNLIFKHHQCKEERCSNHKQCCYVLRSAKTHHRISPNEQTEWAEAVDAEYDMNVSVEMPPYQWIADFAEGKNKTTIKRYGANKKVELVKEDYQPVVINNILPAPPLPVLELSPPQTSEPRHHPKKKQRASNRKQNALIQSSPLRVKPEELGGVMEDFYDYLIDGETDEKRKEAIRFTIKRIEEHFVTFEQLKDDKTILDLAKTSRAPLGILYLIQSRLSDFKRDYKKVQLATSGVLGVKKAREASSSKSDLRRAIGEGSEDTEGENAGYFDSD